jgi:hypothetical protein
MTIRPILCLVVVLTFGGPLFAQDQAEKIVGLGEVCDPNARIACGAGLECNASKPDVAGVCVNSAGEDALREDLGEGVTPHQTAPAR